MKRDANIEAYRVLRRFVPEFRDFVRGQLVGRYGAAQIRGFGLGESWQPVLAGS